MESPLIFNSEIQQVVCVSCQIAVPKSNLERHLAQTQHHQEHSLIIRKGWVESFQNVIVSLPSEAAAQTDYRLEIPNLKTVKGFQCSECDHRLGNQAKMRTHLVESHQSRGKRGRPPKNTLTTTESTGRWSEHWMQTVFGPNSPHHKYFIVRKAHSEVLEQVPREREK